MGSEKRLSTAEWDGTRALAMLRERMNRLFDDNLRRSDAFQDGFSPPTDVYVTDEHVVVTIELPGLDDDAFALDVEGPTLIVRGHRSFRGDGSAYHRLERSYGEFRCQVALPDGVDGARRRARLEAGVLTVEIPRQRTS